MKRKNFTYEDNINYCDSLYCHAPEEYLCVQEESKKEIIRIIEESECEENMSTIQERIGAEFRNERRIGIKEGRAQGLAQAIKQTIERMIKMNLEDDIIKQATGAEKEEIEKIRKEVEE